MKTISIIIPVFNEEKNVPLVYGALISIWKEKLSAYNYEIIYINDGSTDGTADTVSLIKATDSRVKYIEFSRNFGKEAATSAGLSEASGDASILIDADMQHPVNLIPEFISKWEKGADVVVGIRKKNKGEGAIKKIGSYLFYRIMQVISETLIIRGETDYRLMDKEVVEAFNALTEKDRLTRGLINWLGFKREFVEFSAAARLHGKATYSNPKLIKLALSSFVGHSLFPLKIAGYLGIGITIVSGTLGAFIFANKYIVSDSMNLHFSGPAILAVINLFLVGIMLSCLGLISLYIANIKRETGNRPLYVVRKRK